MTTPTPQPGDEDVLRKRPAAPPGGDGLVGDDPRAGAPDAGETEIPVVTGEIVDDGTPDGWRSTGQNWQTMFGRPIGARDIVGLLARSSPQLLPALTRPLQIMAVAVAIPAVICGLLSFALPGGARVVALAITAIGLIMAGILQVRRRRLLAIGAAQDAASMASASPATRNQRLPRILGLAVLAVLAMMLAVGFDLLAVLLIAVGVW